MLPANWLETISLNNSTIFSKIMPSMSKGSAVSRTVIVNSNNKWELYIYGKQVNIDKCSALEGFSSIIPHDLLASIDKLYVCSGHCDSHFVSMVQDRKGKMNSVVLDDHTIDGDLTVRHSKCELLTKTALVCPTCTAYRPTLRSTYSRYKKQSCSSGRIHSRASPQSHVNFRYLTTPEKRDRFTRLKKKAKAIERKLESKKRKIEEMTKASGVVLDEDLDGEILKIMDEHTDSVRSNYAEDSFERLFWEQQKKARKLTNSKQMRWHPMIIKWCLNLKMISSAAYEVLRRTGMLKLPCERTLRDYTHWVKAKPGFQSEVNQQLLKEANIDNAGYHNNVCVVFDEVKIKEGLVYDKESSHLIGFVDIDDINNHLQAYERSFTSDKPKLASHMLVFMVRGLFSALEFPYAQFPSSNLSGDALYSIIWECIANLEALGFNVLALTADGASCNRKFFRMHAPCTRGRGRGELIYKTNNIYASEERPIFFFSDPPHLIKTVRNCWSNSFGHSYTRKLWVCYD